MFLTLLKTSLLCGFLSIGASSKLAYDLAPIDRGISTHVNEYVDIDDDGINYLQIDLSDITGFLSYNFALGTRHINFGNNVRVDYKLTGNDSYSTFNATSYDFIRLTNNDVSWHNGVNYVAIYYVQSDAVIEYYNGSYTQCDSIRIYYSDSYDSSYLSDVGDFVEYFRNNTIPILLDDRWLNSISFKHLADVFISFGYGTDDFTSLRKVGGVKSFESAYMIDYYYWVFDDSMITLGLGGNYMKGVFYVDDSPFYFDNDYQLYVPNGNFRDAIFDAIASDIRDSDSIGNGYQTFSFNYRFNYNAPFTDLANAPFVSDDYFTNVPSDSPRIIKTYDLPLFKSNGRDYNRIQIYYLNGTGMRYEDNGEYYSVNTGGYGYFDTMFYSNTLDDTVPNVLVFKRDFGQYTDGSGNIQTYMANSGSWVNTAYQQLRFYSPLSTTQENNLAQFNNGSFVNGVGESSESLVNSFGLIDTALGGMTSLFKVELLPGITLGVLVFTPFIITLLIFVVKMFKR